MRRSVTVLRIVLKLMIELSKTLHTLDSINTLLPADPISPDIARLFDQRFVVGRLSGSYL